MTNPYRLPDAPSRIQVLAFLSQSVIYGNLGAFIGAGFSKAVLNTTGVDVALSWGDLLRKSAERLGIAYEAVTRPGLDYPAVASALCDIYKTSCGGDYRVALGILKQVVATLTAWYPESQAREEFAQYLITLSPRWIITTNYDLVVEHLLTGRAVSLGPNDPISSSSGVIPVYHLHGSRADPSELIISQEDYVHLFRPTEYRQIKLALTIKESTTLLLGYALGDVNVLTALDWSRNVFRHEDVSYPHDVVQVLRVEHPRAEPYRDRNGILILETAELKAFFKEFTDVHNAMVEQDKKLRTAVESFSMALRNPNNSTINAFIDNPDYRRSILQSLAGNTISLISSFVAFFSKCIDETWNRAVPSGAFEGYNQNLTIILDILTAFPVEKVSPMLFQTVAQALDRVSGLVGPSRGQSFSAGRTWATRKGELSQAVLTELITYAREHNCASLLSLLSR